MEKREERTNLLRGSPFEALFITLALALQLTTC
jgi:hypothetical protein